MVDTNWIPLILMIAVVVGYGYWVFKMPTTDNTDDTYPTGLW